MAVDDVLLTGEATEFPFTLRFYGWRRPTVSLGYAQRWRDGYVPEVGRRLGVGLVRRRTGGRAVLHAHELTYSLAAPAEWGPLRGGIQATYRRVAGGLVAGFAELGLEVDVERQRGRQVGGQPGACFAARARYEILVGGRKLLGSAQRRRGGRLLQHGSLPLEGPDPASWGVLGATGVEASSMSTGLFAELGQRPSRRRIAGVLARALAGELGLVARFGALSNTERRRTRARTAEYESERFTYRR